MPTYPSHARPIALVLALLTACASTSVTSVTPATPATTAATATTSSPPAAQGELVAIDMYGTRQITREQLRAARGPELRAFADAVIRQDDALGFGTLEKRLGELGDFAYASPSIVGYYEPDGMKYYLTIDFVDRADAARRMPFLPAPTGDHADPAGLIADWLVYDAKVSELMASGAMKPERIDCPAFHCLGDGAHPQVKALVDRFAAHVPAHIDELAAILRDDRDFMRRGAAAYLLAYSKDGPALVRLMLGGFRDDSMLVRNNVMRVISDIIQFHPELGVPLEPVLAALDYPATTDRNKASAILDGLLARPGAAADHPTVVARSGATLLAMLRLQQPNNHNFAYRILKALSGQSFGEHDYAAWDAWLAQQAGRPKR